MSKAKILFQHERLLNPKRWYWLAPINRFEVEHGYTRTKRQAKKQIALRVAPPQKDANE